MKAIRILALALAMVMCAALALTSCDKLTKKDIEADPTGQVAASSNDTAESVVRNVSPFEPLIAAIEGKGSMTAVLENEELGGRIDLTVSHDRETKHGAASLALKGEGVDLAIDLNADENGIALSVPALAEKTYGLDFTTIREDLKDSALLKLMGVDYDEIKDDLDEIFRMIDAMKANETPTDTKALEDAAKELCSKLKARLNKCVAGVEKKNVTLGGEDLKAFEVAYKLDANDLIDLLTIVRDNGKALFTEAAKLEQSLVSKFDPESALDFDSVDIEESFEEFMESIDDTVEELSESGKAVNVDLAFFLNPQSAEIMGAKASITYPNESNSDKEDFSLDLGRDPKNSPKAALSWKYVSFFNDAENSTVLNVTVDRVDNDAAFERTVNVEQETKADGYEWGGSTVLSFKNDRAAKTYTLTVDRTNKDVDTDPEYGYEDNSDYHIAVSGKMEYTATELYFTVDKAAESSHSNLDDDFEEEREIGLAVTVKAGVDVPALPEFTNVMKMSNEELLDLAAELTSNQDKLAGLKAIAESFREAPYSYDGEDPDDGFDWIDVNVGDIDPEKLIDFDPEYDYDGDGKVGTDEDRGLFEILESYYKHDSWEIVDGEDNDVYSVFDEDFDYDLDGKTGTDADREEWEANWNIFARDFDDSFDYDHDGIADSDDLDYYNMIRSMISGD